MVGVGVGSSLFLCCSRYRGFSSSIAYQCMNGKDGAFSVLISPLVMERTELQTLTIHSCLYLIACVQMPCAESCFPKM